MDNSKEAIVSNENDDNESTDSSLCIIMAEELDQETNQNNQIESDIQKERDAIRDDDEENPVNGNEDTADSFSAMTQSQYAQVRESCSQSILLSVNWYIITTYY